MKSAIVDVAGATNIQAVTQAHQKLVQGLQQSSAVELHLDSSSEVDLTCVQLVESARQYAAVESKRLVLSAPAEAGLRDVLQRGGFLETAADRAFWLHEAGDK